MHSNNFVDSRNMHFSPNFSLNLKFKSWYVLLSKSSQLLFYKFYLNPAMSITWHNIRSSPHSPSFHIYDYAMPSHPGNILAFQQKALFHRRDKIWLIKRFQYVSLPYCRLECGVKYIPLMPLIANLNQEIYQALFHSVKKVLISSPFYYSRPMKKKISQRQTESKSNLWACIISIFMAPSIYPAVPSLDSLNGSTSF